MSDLFVSDVHLHLDWPERGRKFAAFVEQLAPNDRLIVGGDLHDFWFSSRQRSRADECAGLSALKRFRSQGGEIILIPGNHDVYLRDFYQDQLGCQFSDEPLEINCYGFRIHLLHGHLIAPMPWWKALIARPMFHAIFAATPDLIANRLQNARVESNLNTHEARNEVFLKAYRAYISTHASGSDNEIFVFGHVHEIVDEQVESARMVMLGDWDLDISYLKVDDHGAEQILV